jgi:prepilin-type N-terminal cleavage/methylation domain-containing protein
MAGRKGFTFLEIMFVIVVLGLLAMTTMPRMKGSFRRIELRSASRDVTALLRFARNASVLRELPCEVRFSPEKDIYEFILLDEFGERLDAQNSRRARSNGKVAFEAGEDAVGVRRLPKSIHFSIIYTAAPLTEDSNLPRVIYYPDGSATPATITIQDDQEHAMNVEVFQTTGMARVEKGLPVTQPKKRTLYYGPHAQRTEGS